MSSNFATMKNGICVSRRADRNFESLGPVRAPTFYVNAFQHFTSDIVRGVEWRAASVFSEAYSCRQVQILISMMSLNADVDSDMQQSTVAVCV
jgi:hypothetical protein